MTQSDPRSALTSHAAALLAVDPAGLGGIVLRSAAGPARDQWLEAFRSLLPPDTPWRRLPPQIAEGRLVGGLDLAATLAGDRPVAERGLLAEAHGGIIVVPMAERLEASPASHLAAALDTGEVVVERDGIAQRPPARFAVVLLDEGIDEEAAPGPLSERVALMLDLDRASSPAQSAGEGDHPKGGGGGIRSLDADRTPRDKIGEMEASLPPPLPSAVPLPRFKGEDVAAARRRLSDVDVPNDIVAALAATGPAFGVPSLRLAILAVRVARAAAALDGRNAVEGEDAELAAALVIAPRATRLPAAVDEPDETPDTQHEQPPPETDTSDEAGEPGEAQAMADQVIEATRAAIPTDLLASLSAAAGQTRKATAAGRRGVAQQSARRGRPAGVRRGAPEHGVRLAVVETLRAAAPWQKVRRATASPAASRIQVRREDFRIGRFKERSESLTIFVVDASGSAALHRLAEVKGAVELILAECYVRRDCVALIAFRGERAELVLPPTRSLARAKRALAGQAGGGGTPLAAAIDASGLLAQAARKKGQRPLVVLMTDGKANISRAGRPGRAGAEADAATAAQAFRLGGAAGLVLDISPRPGDAAARLAAAMGARYIPLPYADAQLVSRAVLSAAPGA